MASSPSTRALIQQEVQEGIRVRIQDFTLRRDHEADDQLFDGLQKASEVEEQRAMMDGMRWERYIRGGIFGERYIRRLGLGRKPP